MSANQPTTPHIPIPSIESYHIPLVVFLSFFTSAPVLLTTGINLVRRLRSASIVFVVVYFLVSGDYSPNTPPPTRPLPLPTGGLGDTTKISNYLLWRRTPLRIFSFVSLLVCLSIWEKRICNYEFYLFLYSNLGGWAVCLLLFPEVARSRCQGESDVA